MTRNVVNYLWLDSETTGLDPLKNDIIQLACIPVIAGKEQSSTFNQYCQPINWSAIDQEALDINKISRDKLPTFQKAEAIVNNLVVYLKQFNTKFTIAGFNVGFDKDFLAALFKKVNRENDYIDLFTQDIRDTFKRAKKLKAQLPTQNLKLGTLCAHFGIEIDAHNALSDISATIKLDKILSDMLGETEVFDIEQHVLLDVNFPEPAQLHIHSMFSHTDSINSINEWVEWCEKNNVPGFSAVDHGMAASLFDITRLKNNKVTGVPGVGLIVSHNNIRFYLNAWAVSLEGYKNIVKLASIGWHNRFEESDVEFPVISLDEAVSRKSGIVFGVPGLTGPVAQYLLSRQNSEARAILEDLNNALDIRLELAALDAYKYFDSAIGFSGYNIAGGNLQKHINKFYFQVSKDLDIKCIPVSDAHFIDPNDKIVQDCISKNSYKDARYFFESRHVVKSKEMYSILKGHIGEDLTESLFQGMIQNTYDIVNAAATIKVKHDYHLPKIQIPDNIKKKSDDYNMQTYYYLMQKIKEHGRWNDNPIYIERFKKEIDVIMKNATLNFIPYFLVYEDVCAYARSSGFLQGIARGSAGGSLLSYYLKIIHVDPVAANLPFERFLSHARIRAGSFPDIDLDIADKARPLVMKYLQEKYNLGFAQISTFSKMKTKNAIKDAMYALYGRTRNDEEIKAVCDQIDDSPQGVDEYDFLYGYTDQEGVEHQGEVEKKPILANFFKQRPEVEEMVKKLLGSIRGWSRHASAFVISTLDLSGDRVPTMVMSDKELGDILVTQFDASMIEKSGLVKADILGIKTLSMASDAMALIKKNHNIDFLEEVNGVPLVYRLPDADSGVFSDFYQKDTDSSFQFNTELIKGYAQEFAPLNRADLAAMTALCRPGALDAPLYDTMAAQYFMDVKNGKRQVEYLHPDLEPILKDYNGVFVYQEEVMRFLVEIVGYSWEESDVIRSAIAKKKHEVIMNTFSKIRESCSKRGWSEEAIETVCQQIMAFSRYSFNKSHSYAYGELGYITLYLKHHYPLEWWCGVLNNEDKEEKTRKYISYLGDKVKPPSLKTPTKIYSISENKIVTPISAIKSVGPAVVKEIMLKGPFQSIEDFVERIDHARVNIGSFSALLKARAADDLMDSWTDDIDYAQHINGVKSYIDARLDLMKKYISLRKGKTDFKPEMYELDPIKVFLQEKEYNLSFNKSLLSSNDIVSALKAKWPGLKATGRKNIPLYMKAKDSENETWILNGIKQAENFLRKGMTQEVGMILLYDSSSYKSGISKSGKPWHRVSIMLSDGFNIIEATKWDARKAFGWNKDTIVYVRGELKQGWKTPVSIIVKEIEKVEKV
jgi:DNA polymerase-3 subunit alpha